MGNRCVITDEARAIGIYLHWNGGIGSVEGFLTSTLPKSQEATSPDIRYQNQEVKPPTVMAVPMPVYRTGRIIPMP